MCYFLMFIRTAPANSSYAVPLVDEIPSDTPLGYVVSPLKHPTRPLISVPSTRARVRNTIRRSNRRMPLSLKRAATNPYVALDQICHNLILTVSPHDVLDETYLALELEHDVLDSLSSPSCPSELTMVFQFIALQIALTWIQIYHVIWQHKA